MRPCKRRFTPPECNIDLVYIHFLCVFLVIVLLATINFLNILRRLALFVISYVLTNNVSGKKVILLLLFLPKTLMCIFYCLAQDVYTLINYASFVAWTTSTFATIGLVYLRWKRPDLPRPYKVHFRKRITITVDNMR